MPVKPDIRSAKYYILTDPDGKEQGHSFQVGKRVRSKGDPKHDSIYGGGNIFAYRSPHEVTYFGTLLKNGYHLFEVEGKPKVGFDEENPERGWFTKVNVVTELDTWQLWGPNGQAVELVVDKWMNTSDDERAKIAKASRGVYPSVASRVFRTAYDSDRKKPFSGVKEYVIGKRDDREGKGWRIDLRAGISVYEAAAAIVVADLITESDLHQYLEPLMAGMSKDEQAQLFSLLPKRPQQIDLDTPIQKYKKYSTRWINKQFTRNSPLQVSGRESHVVAHHLRLPDDLLTFYKDMDILSVGEGLSDFAKSIGAFALDPIYEVEGLLNEDPKRIRELLEHAYNGRVTYRADYQEDKRRNPLPDPSKIIPANADRIPFPAESFDYVLGAEVMSYLNLGRSLPEMLRVLRPYGEIRLSGARLQLTSDGKLVPGFVGRFGLSEFGGGINFLIKAEGFAEVMRQISDNGYQAYVLSADSNVRRFCGFYNVTNIFLRKDDQTPRVRPFTSRDVIINDRFEKDPMRVKTEHPLLGQVHKVNPEPVKTPDGSVYPYFYPTTPIK